MASGTPSAGRRRRTLVAKRITVPGNLLLACDQFNAGRYFECHETIEEIWQEEQGEVRDLYKGLIQVAAAFVHVGKNNFVGADRLMRTALGYLEPYRATGAMGFDIDTICRATERSHAAVMALGPRRLDHFPRDLVPRYALDTGALAAESLRWGAWGFDHAGAPVETLIEVVE